MENDYVILRRTEPARELVRRTNKSSVNLNLATVDFAAPALADLLATAKAAGLEAHETIAVEHAKLTTRDAAELMRSDAVVAGARAMPVSLITPLAAEQPEATISQAKATGIAWGVQAIAADKCELSGKDVLVAVLDTGIDPNHSSFKDITLVRQDFTGSATPDDEHGHGTHCAGIFFGRETDGVRIGVAPGVSKALIGKVLNKDGDGSSAAVAAAIHWALQNGANIISMSLGFDYPGLVALLQTKYALPPALAASKGLRTFRDNLRLFDSLMAYAQAQAAFGAGTVFVSASGNESRINENPNFEIEVSLPAASNGIISVGALQRTGNDLFTIAPFSNVDPTLSAPGVNILSAKRGGGLVPMNGTSMACPHVAGAAALWWEHLRSQNLESARLVMDHLTANAVQEVFVPGLGFSQRGAGLVRAPQTKAGPTSPQ